MSARQMRLALGLLFLVMGIGTLVVRFGMPDAAAQFNPTRLMLGGILALVLAGWNFAKWYASLMWYRQRASPARQPLQPGPRARVEEEYNPEFDFGEQDKGK